MARWMLVAWARQLRTELAAIAPARDTASDGSIGDTAHQQSVSGHNPDDTPGVRAERNDGDRVPEVRAIDIDKDFRVPGLTAQMLVAYLVGRCRAGLERRLIYIIWNRTIWSAASGWVARRYTGSNPHTEHIHLSGHPDGDNDARPFGLASLIKEEFVMATKDDVKQALREVLTENTPYQASGPRARLTAAGWANLSMRDLLEYIFEATQLGRDGKPVAGAGRLLADQLTALGVRLDDVDEAVVAALGGRPAADVARALVAAGQNPAELAAALTALARA
ncbi:hypothetical protein AB0873_15055 [Micromonospora sp. NPDC047707]|uniref:hypothetical protein n=1 Tax=Micromonospora sp. NPDC047707 TaxID=3154498 RepID=UPI003452A1BE